jgi:hypothetical protein
VTGERFRFFRVPPLFAVDGSSLCNDIGSEMRSRISTAPSTFSVAAEEEEDTGAPADKAEEDGEGEEYMEIGGYEEREGEGERGRDGEGEGDESKGEIVEGVLRGAATGTLCVAASEGRPQSTGWRSETAEEKSVLSLGTTLNMESDAWPFVPK